MATCLGTPANLGYISGALSTLLTARTTSCLTASRGRAFGAWLHGNEGTEGAERAASGITTSLGWV